MIRFFGATFTTAVIVLLGSIAFAQDATPKIQIFGGYSLFHEDLGGLTPLKIDLALHDPASVFAPRTNYNGWSAEAQYNFDRWFGLAADVSGFSGAPFTASDATGLPNRSRYSILAGPVLSYRNKSKLTPYIHGLFGWERLHLDASTLNNPAAASSVSTTFDDFTMALGGGVDYKITRHVSIRPGQLDWYRTTLNLTNFYGSAFNSEQFEGLSTVQKNLRFSAGVVVQF